MRSLIAKALVVLVALVMVSTALVVVGPVPARAALLPTGSSRTVSVPLQTSAPALDPNLAKLLDPSANVAGYWSKMSSSVREAAQASDGTMDVAIYTTEVAQLGALLRQGGVDTDLGTVPSTSTNLRAVTVEVPAKLLAKIASLEGVVAVAPVAVPQAPDQADPDLPAKAPGNGAAPNLVEAGRGHQVPEAWALGFTGEGVNVAVMDSGVDFGHPDLQGTEARVIDPTSPYFHWPIAFDPNSMAQYLLGGLTFPDSPGSWYVNTSFVSTADPITGELLDSFNGHTYNVSGIPSASGEYHLGLHPDQTLYAYYYGESPAVLVTDSASAGVYDTVYVDLNDDYAFGNDKPVTVDSPEAWADFYDAGSDTWDYTAWDAGDGIADVSGGMVYFISNGTDPVPYSDVIANSYSVPLPIPDAGGLVAFMLGDVLAPAGDHGTLCASSIVAQNVTGHVLGFAPDAKLIAVGNWYAGGFSYDIYAFVAEGYDGIPGTGDEAQVASASFGFSNVFNDGWDFLARYVELMSYVYPDTAFTVSTGNGGHGFGTVTTPSSSNGVISVGASTSYNKDFGPGWFEDANHSTFGDVQPWSNRGPSTLGMTKPDVVTVGAWATGDGTLNEFFGESPWTVWGGTSLSAPATAGIVALIGQAYLGSQGDFTDFGWLSKFLLVDSADNIHYDAQVMGHGLANAYRAVRAASLEDGYILLNMEGYFYPTSDWTTGGYRGTRYESFARIMSPGETDQTLVGVGSLNETDSKDVTISDWELDRIDSQTFLVNTTNALESAGDMARPDYLIDLTPDIPAGTNLVKATVSVPYDQFDPDDDYVRESSWRVLLYDWADYNGNGVYWDDLNANGVVNVGEMDNSAGTEIMRFTYGYPTGTNLEVFVHDPLARIHDGLLLGLQHRFVSSQVPFSNLTVTVDYYQAVDASWLDEDVTAATIAPGDMLPVTLTVTLPVDQPFGTLSAMVTVTDPSGYETQLPVLVNVAATGTDFSFGNDPDSVAFLDNNRVFGGFDWTWRDEAGDWRFFFTDIPDATTIDPGENLLVHTWWENVPTDIDTIIMGNTSDMFSSDMPDLWGPYSLSTVGRSANTLISAGAWRFQTATGGAEEWVSAPLESKGLYEIALHNVLYAGESPSEVFGGEVGTFGIAPSPWVVYTSNAFGNGTFDADSSLDLPGLSVLAYGFGQPVQENDVEIDAGVPWTTTFSASHIGALALQIYDPYSQGMDLDLYLYRRAGSVYRLVASSAGSTADEYISLTRPQDGDYMVLVDPYNLPAGSGVFNYLQLVVAGTQLAPWDVPTTDIPAGDMAEFNVSWNVASGVHEGWNLGMLYLGPTGAPAVQVLVEFYFSGDVWAPEIVATTPADQGYGTGLLPEIVVTYVDRYISAGINYIEFYFDEQWVGYGTFDDTRFQIRLPFVWSDGPHVAQVWVYDAAWNYVTYEWTFTVDTVAPSLMVMAPTLTLTNRPTVDVVGSTDPDATLTVNGAPAEVGPTGDFAASVDLVEGPNVITTVASDVAGNSATDTRTVVLDTIAPGLEVTTPSDGDLVATNVVQVSGTAEVGASLVVNGVAVAIDGSGNWAVDLAFADGDHTITAVATDAAGNAAQDVRTVTVDTMAPALSVTSPTYGLTRTASVDVVGSTDSDATVTVNGDGVTVETDGSFTTTVALSAGSNTITVVATDAAGNAATVTRTIVLDDVAPAVAITSPAGGALLNTPVVHVTGTAEAGAQVTVNGISVVLSGNAWSVDLAFADGDHTITAVATDAAGNAATVSRSVTVDTASPALSVSSPTAALTNQAAATVAGTTEAGATVTVNGNAVTVGTDGTFSTSVTLAAGGNTITVVAADPAGNEATVVRTITLDTVAPVVTVTTPSEGAATSHASVVVTGTVDDASATVLVNGIQVHPSGSGAWSVSVALSEGSNAISVSAVDPAGNVATAVSRQVTYTSPVPGLQDGIDSNTQSINGLSGNLLLGLVAVLVVALAAIGAVYFLLNRKIAGGKKPAPVEEDKGEL